jgi:hypothetical protein
MNLQKTPVELEKARNPPTLIATGDMCGGRMILQREIPFPTAKYLPCSFRARKSVGISVATE